MSYLEDEVPMTTDGALFPWESIGKVCHELGAGSWIFLIKWK